MICRSNIRERCNSTYLAGITIAGSSICGDSSFPGMYTAIFPHVKWIKLMMNEDRNMITRDPTTNPAGGCPNFSLGRKMNQDTNASPHPQTTAN